MFTENEIGQELVEKPYHSHIRCSIPADDMEIVCKFTISFPYHWPACLFHLAGVAKEEVQLKPTSEWSSPFGVFQILREAFSEQLTETQAKKKFLQDDREIRSRCSTLHMLWWFFCPGWSD